MQPDLTDGGFPFTKKVIDINETVKHIKKTHKGIMPNLLALHALTGCDSVSRLYGIGKRKALKVGSGIKLTSLGDINATLENHSEDTKIPFFTGFFEQKNPIKNGNFVFSIMSSNIPAL